MSRFEVRVSKDYLVFPAGHFITYDGKCESLHGHNYRASVSVEGDIDENHFVLDFVDLKRMMREIVGELDHKMLLPTENPALTITEEDGGVRVRYRDRLYVFPRQDVVFLPVPNTTAEMIARYLAERLRDALGKRGVGRLSGISVEIEESFGQSAIYRESLE
ncbi:MAG: 6-pyruvoyl tetrahydropterin synthase family protein [Gemmatimonadota bacterium]